MIPRFQRLSIPNPGVQPRSVLLLGVEILRVTYSGTQRSTKSTAVLRIRSTMSLDEEAGKLVGWPLRGAPSHRTRTTTGLRGSEGAKFSRSRETFSAVPLRRLRAWPKQDASLLFSSIVLT
jgi:hypothetical protein